MSTRTNNYSNRYNDSWGAMPIGLGISETKKVQKDYYSKFLDNLFDGFFLPLIIIKQNSGKICVEITQNNLIDLPFNRFAEGVAKKYGKLETLYIRVNTARVTKKMQDTIKLWTLYGTMFCRYCFLNDLSLKCANKPVAHIGSPVHINKLHFNGNINPRALSLKNLKLRDEFLKIDWSVNNTKEIQLFEYFSIMGVDYKIHRELYKRYSNFLQDRYYLDEEEVIIDERYVNTVEDLEPKHNAITKLYGMSLDYEIPQTYFKYNKIWINHPYDNTQNKQIEYTQMRISGDFKYKSFIARKNLKPTYTIEKLSNNWVIPDTDLKKLLSDTSDYTLCEVTEEQTWVSYNLKEPHKKTVHQELVTYNTIMSDAEIDKLRDDIEIEYTSFEDTYSDDYENSMCPYEDSINKLYEEAEAEEEAECENLWED